MSNFTPITAETIRNHKYTDEQSAAMYAELLQLGNAPGKRVASIPTKWSDNEFTTASGYAIRVAQNHTLEEFRQWVKTGQPLHPVKMTPAEMEVLLGGSKATDWIQAGTAVVAAGAAAAGACA